MSTMCSISDKEFKYNSSYEVRQKILISQDNILIKKSYKVKVSLTRNLKVYGHAQYDILLILYGFTGIYKPTYCDS